MGMPKPDEHHEKLKALVGEWTGEETLHPIPWQPDKVAVTSRVSSRLDLDGFFLFTDHEQTRDGRVSYRGHGIFGWDPRKQRYTMHWFDVMGVDPGPPAMGTWEGNKLCLQHQHHMGHSRYTYKFEGDGPYTFTLETSQDGQDWPLFLTGTYRRVS